MAMLHCLLEGREGQRDNRLYMYYARALTLQGALDGGAQPLARGERASIISASPVGFTLRIPGDPVTRACRTVRPPRRSTGYVRANVPDPATLELSFSIEPN